MGDPRRDRHARPGRRVSGLRPMRWTVALALTLFVLSPVAAALLPIAEEDGFLLAGLPLVVLGTVVGVRTCLHQRRPSAVATYRWWRQAVAALTAAFLLSAVLLGGGRSFTVPLLAVMLGLLAYFIVLLLALLLLLVVMLGVFVRRSWQVGPVVGVWATSVAAFVIFPLTAVIIAVAAGAESDRRRDILVMFDDQPADVASLPLAVSRVMMLMTPVFFLLVVLLVPAIRRRQAGGGADAAALGEVEDTAEGMLPSAMRREGSRRPRSRRER